jgi:acyl-CoA thioesterase I
MNQKKKALLTIVLSILLVSSGISAYFIWSAENKPPFNPIRVACVGDSLTQLTAYPYDLWTLLGRENYTVGNFGAGSTTISLNTETPYMNTSFFQKALQFQPNIAIIMLGTNDAQPNLKGNNVTLTADYVKLIDALQALSSRPKIWVVLPPPIFGNQSGKLDAAFFTQIIIPDIKQAANETNVPTIDVYSALTNYPNYFPDGEHPNSDGAQVMANTIYKALTTQNTAND